MISYIIGKTCEEYIETLNRLEKTPLKLPNLNEDSFTNAIINRYPIYEPRKVYVDGVLELHHE